MLETITVIAGRRLVEWQEVEIDIGVDRAVRTASLTMHIPPGMDPPWPGTPATISASGTLLLTGYVRDVNTSQGEEEWQARIGFVSRTVDAVEASIVHPTGFTKNKDIGGIAKEFDTCGVGVQVSGAFEKLERHQIDPGESMFDTIEPLARATGAMIHDSAAGLLRITNKPDGVHSGGLAQGVNIIKATAQFSDMEKFDTVTIRGQQMRGVGPTVLRPEGEARDPSVRRYRPKVNVLQTEATAATLRQAAEWRVRQAAGSAATAQIEASGWRDMGRKVWTPNYRVYVRHPRVYLDQMMAIKSVKLKQSTVSEEGTRTILSLVDPRALGGGSAGGKSGGGWQAPEPSAIYRAL